MSTVTPGPVETWVRDPLYPDSDGQPMAENTIQYEWIVRIVGNLQAMFRDRPDVFVAGDLLWYPVEGDPKTRMAPDAMVAFGRPRGHRGSYMQWHEGGTPPHVVFEVLSPGNRLSEMLRKLKFYERFGVEEYYLYDPDRKDLAGWLRDGESLREIDETNGWTSPRLGITFHLDPVAGLEIVGPDGREFSGFVELTEELDAVRERAEAEREKAQAERERAEVERERAQAERERAQAEHARAEAERERADRLAARLRELGLGPDA
jgi:Uma2 family endonuclease